MNIGTWLHTLLHGRLVGRDMEGNRYYQSRARRGARPRRWVIYRGEVEASRVGPAWHGWLHHLTDAPLPEAPKYPWQKPHLPNLTGTPASYRPPGHAYRAGAPRVETYQAWVPGETPHGPSPHGSSPHGSSPHG